MVFSSDRYSLHLLRLDQYRIKKAVEVSQRN